MTTEIPEKDEPVRVDGRAGGAEVPESIARGLQTCRPALRGAACARVVGGRVVCPHW